MLTEFETLQAAYKDQSTKLSAISKESGKSAVLKETVKKQEQVISKLEGLLEKLMRERKAKEQQEQDNKWKHKLESASIDKAQEEQLRLKIKRQE